MNKENWSLKDSIKKEREATTHELHQRLVQVVRALDINPRHAGSWATNLVEFSDRIEIKSPAKKESQIVGMEISIGRQKVNLELSPKGIHFDCYDPGAEGASRVSVSHDQPVKHIQFASDGELKFFAPDEGRGLTSRGPGYVLVVKRDENRIVRIDSGRRRDILTGF